MLLAANFNISSVSTGCTPIHKALNMTLVVFTHIVDDLATTKIMHVASRVLAVPGYRFSNCFVNIPQGRPSKLVFGFGDVELQDVGFVGGIWV